MPQIQQRYAIYCLVIYASSNNNIFKPGMMKTKSTTEITLERIRRREILEEQLSNFKSNGNTLVLKLKDSFLGFHIIMFHNLHLT